MWTIFQSLLYLLQYCFCFILWVFGCKVCGILASQPGIKPTSPALESKVLITRPPRKFLDQCFLTGKAEILLCFPCSELFLLHANKKVSSGPMKIYGLHISWMEICLPVSKLAGSQSKLKRVNVIESERYLFFFHSEKKNVDALCPSLIIPMIHLPENRWEKRSKSLS